MQKSKAIKTRHKIVGGILGLFLIVFAIQNIFANSIEVDTDTFDGKLTWSTETISTIHFNQSW